MSIWVTIQSPAPSLSSRTPDILRRRTKTSLGHLQQVDQELTIRGLSKIYKANRAS